MSVRTGKRVGAAFLAAVLLTVAAVAAFVIGQAKTAQAAPAYQNGFIAFGPIQGGWEVVNPDGSDARMVSFSSGPRPETFRYSPDGRRVAMFGQGELWVQTVPDVPNQAHKIADIAAGRFAWSPDGSQVVYADGGEILTVPADGGPPVRAFTDLPGCSDSNPQVSTRGYIFFTRSGCSAAPAGPVLAMYRPGDSEPSYVAPHGDAIVSPDGSHMLWLEPASNGSCTILVAKLGVIGGKKSYRVGGGAVTCPTGVDFGPSGTILVTQSGIEYPGPYGTGYSVYWLREIADSPNASYRVIASGPWIPFTSVPFVQWVNGPSNIPARPIAERIGGADRVDTAVKASQWSYDGLSAHGRHASAAVLVRSDLFPDALTGTALAIQAGGPLLLTPTGSLDPAVGAELRRILAPGSTVYLLGGTAAIRPAVADAVQRLGFTPVRLGGSDRYGTAAVVASAGAGTDPSTVVLATGTDFPDALTAGVAAGQDRYLMHDGTHPAGAAILLTDGTTMPTATRAYLQNLRAHTESTAVYAVGGPAATALDSAFPGWPSAVRLVGTDRFDTAAKVATSALFGNSEPGRYTVAAVATGLDFPDALSGGALAGAQGGPLLLTDATGLTPGEAAVLKSAHLTDLTVLGGPKAVSPAALTATADTVFGPHAWDGATNRAAPPLR